MKRYLAMLGMATVLALPAAVGAEVKPGTEEYFILYGTHQVAEPVTKQDVIKEEEPVKVSTPDATAPAKAKADQESYSANPYLENGLNW